MLIILKILMAICCWISATSFTFHTGFWVLLTSMVTQLPTQYTSIQISVIALGVANVKCYWHSWSRQLPTQYPRLSLFLLGKNIAICCGLTKSVSFVHWWRAKLKLQLKINNPWTKCWWWIFNLWNKCFQHCHVVDKFIMYNLQWS